MSLVESHRSCWVRESDIGQRANKRRQVHQYQVCVDIRVANKDILMFILQSIDLGIGHLDPSRELCKEQEVSIAGDLTTLVNAEPL